MAKSKKALKALKRRKEAKGRSRVLKERQDYTAGGRVKSQFGGFIPNLDMAEIEKELELLLIGQPLIENRLQGQMKEALLIKKLIKLQLQGQI